MSEQEKSFAERMNELMGGLNDEGRRRLLDIARGYEMCLRDNKAEIAGFSPASARPPGENRPAL